MLANKLRMVQPPSESISFIDSAFNDSGGSLVSSYSQSVPSGLAGDLLIFIFAGNNSVIYDTPDGWTDLASVGNANRRSSISYKIATSSSESNFTASTNFSGNAVLGGVVLRFRNVGEDPFAGTYANATFTTAITASAVSATTGDFVLQCFISGSSGRTWATPTVSDGVLFTDSNAFQPSIAVFYQLGGSSNASSSVSGSTSTLNAIQIRLRP